MKINGRLTLIMLSVLLIGSLYISTSVVTPASAVGTLSGDILPGETYYYEVTEFPTYQELIDRAIDLSGEDPFDENNSLSVDGTLQGSQIYVKVINTDTEKMDYWDGQNVVTANVPTVDITAGLITGGEVTIDATVEGENFVNTLPAGAGLPIPTIFGTATQFNVSMDGVPKLLPIPLVLNNDYALHDTIFTQLQNQINGLFITNDNSQFKVDLQNAEIGDADIVLDGFISWRKTDGLAQELNLEITNSTTNEELISLDIDLVEEEYHPLPLEVGDTYSLTLADAGIDAVASGDAAEDIAEINDGIAEVNANLTEQIGDILIEFTVLEVDGLYYNVEGQIRGDDFELVDFPENDAEHYDLWMVGFGRYGPGMPIGFENPARSEIDDCVEYMEDEFGEEYCSDSEERYVLPRERALVGPVVTEDYGIYQSWDITIGFLVALANNEFADALDILLAESDDDMFWGSDGTGVPTINVAYAPSIVGDEYSYKFEASVDAKVKENRTDDDEMNPEVRYQNITVSAEMSAEMKYDRGVFTSFELSVEGSFNVVEYNATHTKSDNTITVNEAFIELSADYDISFPDDDPSNTTDTDDTGEPTVDLPLPGFELFLSFFAVLGVATIIRKRR